MEAGSEKWAWPDLMNLSKDLWKHQTFARFVYRGESAHMGISNKFKDSTACHSRLQWSNKQNDQYTNNDDLAVDLT